MKYLRAELAERAVAAEEIDGVLDAEEEYTTFELAFEDPPYDVVSLTSD
mgnify:CR=1 FL=1